MRSAFAFHRHFTGRGFAEIVLTPPDYGRVARSATTNAHFGHYRMSESRMGGAGQGNGPYP
jgi:hypothetical protein